MLEIYNLPVYLATVVMLAGYIIGLGAVTVIDLHGFLGRKSPYWTEATVRTHKVTKPLIWLGLTMVVIGTYAYFTLTTTSDLSNLFFAILTVLFVNGLFLSFYVSPFLLRQEKAGRASQLLPLSLQIKITFSFLISFSGWWGSFLLLIFILHSTLSKRGQGQ